MALARFDLDTITSDFDEHSELKVATWRERAKAAYVWAEDEMTHAVEEADATPAANGHEEGVRLDDKPLLLGVTPSPLGVARSAKPTAPVARVELLHRELFLPPQQCGRVSITC